MVADDPESFADLDGHHLDCKSSTSTDKKTGAIKQTVSCHEVPDPIDPRAFAFLLGAVNSGPSTAEKERLRKEIDGMRSDRQRVKSLVRPLIETFMTVMMFAGEGDSVAPEPDYLPGDEILTEGSIFRSETKSVKSKRSRRRVIQRLAVRSHRSGNEARFHQRRVHSSRRLKAPRGFGGSRQQPAWECYY
jgi:hypothetical protein